MSYNHLVDWLDFDLYSALHKTSGTNWVPEFLLVLDLYLDSNVHKSSVKKIDKEKHVL